MRRFSLLAALAALTACSPQGDWHQAAIADEEQQIRDDLGNQDLQFSDVQFTGDNQSGQTCGKVFGKGVSSSFGTPARFIVFIDKSAGPWIEGGQGKYPVSSAEFEINWQDQCVKLGWGK